MVPLLVFVSRSTSQRPLDSVHKVMLNNGKQHANVVSGKGLLAPTLFFPKSWAVVSSDIVMDWHCPHLHHPTKLVHLIDPLRTGEPCFWSCQGSCSKEREEKHRLHSEICGSSEQVNSSVQSPC